MKTLRKPEADFENIVPILIGCWRRMHKLSGPADRLQTREFRGVVAEIAKMILGLEKGNSLVGSDYFASNDMLGAYLFYQWMNHYQQGLSILNEIPQKNFAKVLDLCSGPAPLALAALKHGAKEVTLVDKSLPAMQLGADICGRYGYPVSFRKANVIEGLKFSQKYDLIMVGHAMLELFISGHGSKNQLKMVKWIESLLNQLTDDGHLVIIDSSLPAINTEMLRLRDELVRLGAKIQAPCVWQGACPALQTKGAPCYAQREMDKPYILKEVYRAAQINANSLKMSYLILKSPASKWPEMASAEAHYRVISPPVEGTFSKRFYLCGTDGKKSIEARQKELPKSAKAFEYLKRGELIAVSDEVRQGNIINVTDETTLKVVAAAGKPLPELF